MQYNTESNQQTELKEPYCPNCLNGKIVYLKNHNIFICNRCKRQARIEQKENL